MISNILSIAGSDPSGGAGIQADLKTFAALDCYGMAVITALTAQNTKGVYGIHEIPAQFVAQQIEAVFDDIRVDAVKIGMAGGVETICAIVAALAKYKPCNVVLDPVMISQSGAALINDEAVDALKKYLIPLATILTPNIPEAVALLGSAGQDREAEAKRLLSLGAPAVLLKGGHMEGPICFDVYAGPEGVVTLEAPRIPTNNNHGTGCTLSSAIAAHLAKGLSPLDACRAAKDYITEALRHADELEVGEGHGPVQHSRSIRK